MNIQAMYNKKWITHNLKRSTVLIIFFLSAYNVWATDNVVNINSQMPSREVSVVARQSIVLQPGFHAIGSSGTFDAKIGNINSVCPTITLADGSGSVLQSIESEKVNTSKSCVKVITPLQPVYDASMLKSGNCIVEESYFDGLGRVHLNVIKSFCPNGKDLATLVNFDAYGRLSNRWLPTPINSSKIPDPNIVIQQAKNYYNDSNPYYSFDESSIICTKTFKPGAIYRSQNKSFDQGFCNAALSTSVIRRYVVDQNNITLLELFDVDIQQTIDEDGHVTNVYTNFLGQVVLKQMIDNGVPHDTYYIYDDLGRLCYVLSPEASDKMAAFGTYSRAAIDMPSSTLSQFAYAYKYDEAGRCIAKKIPGKAWENIIYDQANQVVFTQDGNQRLKGQWLYYKYDSQGRPIQSGITSLTDSEAETIRTTYASTTAMENYVIGSGYTNTKPLGVNSELLTQQFYDSYDFLNLSAFSALNLAYSGSNEAKYSKVVGNVDIALLGKLTGKWVAMLDNTTTTLLTAMYYDDKGRVIQSIATNQLNGYDKDSYIYNFSGQMLSNTHIHNTSFGNSSTSVTELYQLSYDKMGRMTSVRHKLNTQAEIVLDSLLYDETGHATRKILHGGIQAIDYAYSLQGQLKSLTSPAFAEILMYSEPDPNGTPLYNGSIASIQYGNGTGYQYNYDGLNRLKTANYTDVHNPDNNGAFNERVDTYDKNGNITKLTRSGLARDQFNMMNGVAPIVKHDIDQLTMTYAGNQIQIASDGNNTAQYLSVGMGDFNDVQDVAHANEEYQYDKNGNCTADLNKGIAWTSYNLLNRSQIVQMTNGNKTLYAYDASGVKRRAVYYTAQSGIQVPLGDYNKELDKTYGVATSSSSTDYCGRYVYVDGALTRILTPEGYVQVIGLNSANWRYAYNITDHVGSSRAQLVSDPLSNATSKAYTVTSTSEYYPMGMEIRRSFDNTSGTNPYLYGGNELERMHGLNLYEFPYRWYDYAVPGFTTPDPLAEKHYSESPYSYCGGDPVNRVDPLGLDWFKSSDNQFITCLSDDVIAALIKDKRIVNGVYSNSADGKSYTQVGKTYHFTVNNHNYFGNENCEILREQDYIAMTQNPQAYTGTSRFVTISMNAELLDIKANISNLNRIHSLNAEGNVYQIDGMAELTIPVASLIIPEIKIEPLPGIEMPMIERETTSMPMAGAYLNGLYDGLNSVGNMALDPLNTLNDMGNAIIHYDQTYSAFNNLSGQIFSSIINRDGVKIASYTGNFLGSWVGIEATAGAVKGVAQTARNARLARAVTTTDGFLIGSIGFKAPFDLKVGLYASENTLKYGTFQWSTIAPDILTKNQWFGRRMLQITPEFQQTLGPWSSQVIPQGTYLRIGLVGHQTGVGFGSWFQLYAPQGVNFLK